MDSSRKNAYEEARANSILMINISMKIEVGDFDIEIFKDIGAVQNDWQWLEKEGLSTPFQRLAWLLPFYNILASQLDVTPLFVRVRDRQSHNPVMLMPLCTRRRCGISVIEFADLGVSDYNAPVIAKNFAPSPTQWKTLWEKIVAALNQGSILWLRKMPSMIGDRPNPLVQYNKKAGVMSDSSWGIALPATFAAYNRDMLNPSFTKELERKVRRVTKRGNMEYAVTRTREDRHRVFAILMHQKQARRDAMGLRNVLEPRAYREFYEAVVMGTPDTQIQLAALKVGGEEVATLLALKQNKGLHVIVSTFEGGEWKSASLGNVTMRMAIAHAIEQGIDFFDLTIGNESYKPQFGATSNALYSAMHSLSLIGIPAIWLLGVYLRIKKEDKLGVVAEGVLSRVKQGMISFLWTFNHRAHNRREA